MLKYADLVEQHVDKIAHLESIAMGQPISIAKVMVSVQISSFRYYAGLTDKIPGESYPENGDGVVKMVNYEPLGVCAGISAWNGTQVFVGWKVRSNRCFFPLLTLADRSCCCCWKHFHLQVFREESFGSALPWRVV